MTHDGDANPLLTARGLCDLLRRATDLVVGRVSVKSAREDIMKRLCKRLGIFGTTAVAAFGGSALLTSTSAFACTPNDPAANTGVGYEFSPGPNAAAVGYCADVLGARVVDNGAYAGLDFRVPVIGPAPGGTGASVTLTEGYALCTYKDNCTGHPFPGMEYNTYGAGVGYGGAAPIAPSLGGGPICVVAVCPSGGAGLSSGGVAIYANGPTPVYVVPPGRTCVVTYYGTC